MNISLPPELEEYVNQRVRAGHYPDPSAVVRTALKVLRNQDTAALRKAIAVGLEQSARGHSTPWGVEEIKVRGRQLLAAQQTGARRTEF